MFYEQRKCETELKLNRTKFKITFYPKTQIESHDSPLKK